MAHIALPVSWKTSLLAIIPGLLATLGLIQKRLLNLDGGRSGVIGHLPGVCLLVE